MLQRCLNKKINNASVKLQIKFVHKTWTCYDKNTSLVGVMRCSLNVAKKVFLRGNRGQVSKNLKEYMHTTPGINFNFNLHDLIMCFF